MVVVSFDIYSQQFTLCYCLVKSPQKPSSSCSLTYLFTSPVSFANSLVVHSILRKTLDPPLKQYLTAARLAQLGERRSAERKAVGSNPGRTNTQGL